MGDRGGGVEDYRMRSVIICSNVAHMQDMRNSAISKKTVVCLVLLLLVTGSL